MAARVPLDGFERQQNVDSPARYAFAIAPHDTNALEQSTRGIYIGGAGNLKVRMTGFANNVTSEHGFVTFTAVVAGTILPIRADLVHTDTTATLLIGLY